MYFEKMGAHSPEFIRQAFKNRAIKAEELANKIKSLDDWKVYNKLLARTNTQFLEGLRLEASKLPPALQEEISKKYINSNMALGFRHSDKVDAALKDLIELGLKKDRGGSTIKLKKDIDNLLGVSKSSKSFSLEEEKAKLKNMVQDLKDSIDDTTKQMEDLSKLQKDLEEKVKIPKTIVLKKVLPEVKTVKPLKNEDFTIGTPAKVLLGTAAAGTLLAGAGGIYYLNKKKD